MVDTELATLSQDGTSVELPLLAEGSSILLAADLGKPDLIIHDDGGTAFPRVQDQWSGFQQFNVIGFFRGDTAHSDAIDLAELVHSDGGGNPMTLDIPGIPELPSDMRVAPSAEQAKALNLSYPNAYKNRVDFDLGLTRVDDTLGSYDRTITTPTASGTGPVELSAGGTTVELVNDIKVDRYIGRPNDVVRKHPANDYPTYEPKRKVTNDEFEISLAFSTDAVAKTRELSDLFSQQFNRSGITLNFNGLYGMGEFTVIPQGSSALRHVRESGKEGVSIIPTVALRRINEP